MIQAHRGSSAYCPENTLEAFSMAVAQKADGIELDVQLSKDGHVVVVHDENLERVSNGKGFIHDHTLEELKSLDCSKLFPNRSPCRIPALAEVYSLIKPTSLMVNVELKTSRFLYPGLPEKLAALGREYAMEERIIYSSFNHYSLLEIKKLCPSAKTGLLYQMGMVDPWVYANYVKAYAIHPHYFVITHLPETVENCHKNGVCVNVWTVDDPEAIKQLVQYGVDTIITNKPDIALAVRDGM
jgi:glycerophosphoryl diester phosphodiesterase